MIKQYVVAGGQNIMDVVLATYGSLDGLTDFLMHNPDIDLNSNLEGGQVVLYEQANVINEVTINYFSNNNVYPLNSERNVYYKESSLPLVAYILIPPSVVYVGCSIWCDGRFEIDWGDDTDIESFTGNVNISHSNNSNINDNRIIRLYSADNFNKISFNNIPIVDVFIFESRVIYQFDIVRSRELCSIGYCKLIKNLRDINMSGSKIADILYLIGCESIRSLNLNGCGIQKSDLDSYFIGLVKNYQSRVIANVDVRNNGGISGIYQSPSNLSDPKSGLEAVWVLENERSWKISR